MRSWTLLKEVYEWNKLQLWIYSLACIATSLINIFYGMNPFIYGLAMLGLFIKVVHFYRTSGINWSVTDKEHVFSWKYLQSLPMDKKELIKFVSFSAIISQTPLFIWLVCFHKVIIEYLFMTQITSFSTSLKIIVFSFVWVLFVDIWALITKIQFPRQQYIKRSEPVVMFNGFKSLAFWTFMFLASVFALAYLSHHFPGLEKKLGNLLVQSWKLFGGWWFTILMSGILFYTYHRLIKIWQNETLSYRPLAWSPVRDIPLFSLYVLGSIFMAKIILFQPPALFTGHEFLEAIYHRDQKQITHLLGDPRNAQVRNKFGFTPLMASALIGDINLY